MEEVVKKNTRKSTVNSTKIKEKYIEHVLLEGGKPASVYAFAKSLRISEPDFYNHYGSFQSLEQSIWKDWFLSTTTSLDEDDSYPKYSIREKLLAFYYTWIELLKDHRSFVLKSFEGVEKSEIEPTFLSGLRKSFRDYVKDLVIEGKDTTEIAERPFSNQYDKAFWVHFLYITRFWLNDDSEGFGKTDAAIEKSVNLAMDLIGRGPLESLLDFGKFMFQNR